ncbi:MAG: TIGR04372 family glycosyltransferase [Chlorobium sp.]|nr:MAG: TIGR04372 family glycosyltransferase [Chlorobium sp.]
MILKEFIERQFIQIRSDGIIMLLRKMNKGLIILVIATPIVIIIRLIKPWLLIRFGSLMSSRIGHFVANTEVYLCEREAGINVPLQRHVDIFYFGSNYPFDSVCNEQLALMWKRILRVWPEWILAPIVRVNRLIPNCQAHEIGNNTNEDRDINNLFDRFPSHLRFTTEEDAKGEKILRDLGVPDGESFVCLNVRDSSYLSKIEGADWSFNDYRDSDIQTYVLAAEELADRGYYVIRMGAKVHEAMKSNHSRVIDYASNGMRSDFMDIYLGSKCLFAISTGTGWDTVPYVFRKPICFVNFSPIGYMVTYRDCFLTISKYPFSIAKNKKMTLSEIFSDGVGLYLWTSLYESNKVKLIDNTSQEICDVAIEMCERINGSWSPQKDDEALQLAFWEMFPSEAVDYKGKPLHGEIRARFGASFLRNNRDWLQ